MLVVFDSIELSICCVLQDYRPYCNAPALVNMHIFSHGLSILPAVIWINLLDQNVIDSDLVILVFVSMYVFVYSVYLYAVLSHFFFDTGCYFL